MVGIVITFVWLSAIYSYNREWNLLLEQRLYDDPIVFSQTTKYQHLIITHRQLPDEYRLYINGNTQFSSSDEAIYHENLVHPAMVLVPDHPHVLILGGGDGLALREVLKYGDVEAVTLVDLDPMMTKIASTNPIFTQLNDNAFSNETAYVIKAEDHCQLDPTVR